MLSDGAADDPDACSPAPSIPALYNAAMRAARLPDIRVALAGELGVVGLTLLNVGLLEAGGGGGRVGFNTPFATPEALDPVLVGVLGRLVLGACSSGNVAMFSTLAETVPELPEPDELPFEADALLLRCSISRWLKTSSIARTRWVAGPTFAFRSAYPKYSEGLG